MWSLEIVVGEPVHELHLEVFETRKAISVPKVVIDNFPEPLYLSIGLRASDLGILVDDSKFLQYYLKTMFAPRREVMRRKLKSVICHDSFDSDSFGLVPFVGSSHKVCKCFGSLVGDDLNIGDTGSIIDDSCPVLLLAWVLSFDILHLVEIYVYHLSCHSFLIAYDTCLSFYTFQELDLLFAIRRKLVPQIRPSSTLV